MARSENYVETVKCLVSMRDGNRIETDTLRPTTGRAIVRMVAAHKARQKVAVIKEIRALAECGLREAVDLYNKYLTGA